MLHIVESRKPLDRVAKDLEEAVARHKFGVLGVHDLKAKMAEKGVVFSRECRIFEVCNPAPGQEGPGRQPRDLHGAAVPHLGLRGGRGHEAGDHQAHGHDRRCTPTPGLKDVAREVEATLEAIMAEAAR